MHYVIFKNEKEIVKKPIEATVSDSIPPIARDLAAVAERYGSHIEIDADSGNIFMIDDETIHPTMQVARAVEAQYVYDKYGVVASENIKRIPNKYLSDTFDGSLYVYTYITPKEFQGSIIVLDNAGDYLSTYDELEEAFVPKVEGLDEKAVNLCKQVFEIMTENYKNTVRAEVAKGTIK